MGFYRNVPLKEKNANVREKMGYRESVKKFLILYIYGDETKSRLPYCAVYFLYTYGTYQA